jgi:nicotinate-nucleotide pyrophosphorylase (carboxylating)
MLDVALTAGLTALERDEFVDRVLAEDVRGGDATTLATIGSGARFRASISARHDVVVAGVDLAIAFFIALDPDIEVERLVSDGEIAPQGTAIIRLSGQARAMLAAERSALNTLQHLSGIATLTREYADAIAGTGCILLDTRKTIPGLRKIEKYAAWTGGATNHRMGLDDAILIKDNHLVVAGDVANAVRAAKNAATGLLVQVEVDRLDQIPAALEAGADRLLCDNMSPAMLRDAVALVAGRVKIEASGGVRLDTICEIASTGVDYVSVGRITQSAPAADIGLDYFSID